MRRRPASSKRARRALTFWDTRSGHIATRRMATGIWGQARPRRRGHGSRRRWEPIWYQAIRGPGRRCGTGSIRFCEAGRRTSATGLGRRRIGRLTTTSIKAYGISCGGDTRCNRVARAASAMKWCSGSWESSGFVTCSWDLVRESTVKPVGKPDAGNRHVRFDERGRETGRRFGVSARARPRLYQELGCSDVARALVPAGVPSGPGTLADASFDTVSQPRTRVEMPGTGPQTGSLDTAGRVPAPHRLAECEKVGLKGGFSSSLYSLPVGRDIRLIMTMSRARYTS